MRSVQDMTCKTCCLRDQKCADRSDIEALKRSIDLEHLRKGEPAAAWKGDEMQGCGRWQPIDVNSSHGRHV